MEDGIPNLLPLALQSAPDDPNASHEVTEKQSEIAARDAQVSAYDAMLGLRVFTAAEVPLTLRYLAPEPDHLLLEGGCGTGRMTGAFAKAVRGLACVDFSRESLKVARAKLAPDLLGKILFVQADLSHLPLRSGAFDRVGTFGVYEHIPTEESRDRALSELARAMKPREQGSRFAISAYRWGPPQSWASDREGHHDGGIYFLRLTQAELLARLAPYIEPHGQTEVLLYYHLIWGRRPAASGKS